MTADPLTLTDEERAVVVEGAEGVAIGLCFGLGRYNDTHLRDELREEFERIFLENYHLGRARGLEEAVTDVSKNGDTNKRKAAAIRKALEESK